MPLWGLEALPQPQLPQPLCDKTFYIHRILCFPLNKTHTLADKASVRALHHAMISSFPISALFAFSDGSISADQSVTTCAIYIPCHNYSKSWRLSPSTSIVSAEFHGIFQILRYILDYPSSLLELIIFRESAAAIKEIYSTSLVSNDRVPSIHNSLSRLKQSGTLVCLRRISSHVRISGNEKVYFSALSECSFPSAYSTTNSLSPSEYLATVRKKRNSDTLEIFK